MWWVHRARALMSRAERRPAPLKEISTGAAPGGQCAERTVLHDQGISSEDKGLQERTGISLLRFSDARIDEGQPFSSETKVAMHHRGLGDSGGP